MVLNTNFDVKKMRTIDHWLINDYINFKFIANIPREKITN